MGMSQNKTLKGYKTRLTLFLMKNLLRAKIMFQSEGIGYQLIGLGLSLLNKFHVYEILGILFTYHYTIMT